MAQARDNVFGPSSPHSSGGVPDSFAGTPDTRLAAFSAADGSGKSTRLLPGNSCAVSTTPPARPLGRGFLDSVSQVDKDPFISPGRRTGLSPTASSFQPFNQPPFVPSTLPGSIVSSVLSNDLGVSRLISVSGFAKISVAQVESWLKELEDRGVPFLGRKSVRSTIDVVYVLCSDIRDACTVHATSRLTAKDWKLDFADPKVLPKNDTTQHDVQVDGLGQIQIVAMPKRETPVDVFQAIDLVKNFLLPYGQLFAFMVLSTSQDGSFRAIAEFCNVNAAIAAVGGRRNTHVLNGVHLEMSLHDPDAASTPDVTRALRAMTFERHDELFQQHRGDTTIPSRPVATTGTQFSTALAMYPVMLQNAFNPNMSFLVDRYPNQVQASALMTPMSPSYQMVGSLYRTPPSPALSVSNNQSPSRPMPMYGRGDARRQNATRVNRSPHTNAASHHNHVDIHRIREGIDVRTTIMLRNIPNKVDQAMLKRIVDESSWGKYDFMYLRIDFANDCNVGYAFINFVDPLDIIDFVDARGNQRWNCFKSDKVAEISYATIQGKDCLVQKFRNSSVMLEAPHYRPKLYFTSNGPMPDLAGQEEPFPDPDNQSKMKRSCENAEHVGLFTPNAGQHFRDEQRRRRSQYDRGTRLAALEEYDYDAAVHHQIYDPES